MATGIFLQLHKFIHRVPIYRYVHSYINASVKNTFDSSAVPACMAMVMTNVFQQMMYMEQIITFKLIATYLLILGVNLSQIGKSSVDMHVCMQYIHMCIHCYCSYD